MLRARNLALLALLALALGVAFAGDVEARPTYCNYQCHPPYYSGPDDICTCPNTTALYGQVTNCYGYFDGHCDGETSPPPSDGAVTPEICTEPETDESLEATDEAQEKTAS